MRADNQGISLLAFSPATVKEWRCCSPNWSRGQIVATFALSGKGTRFEHDSLSPSPRKNDSPCTIITMVRMTFFGLFPYCSGCTHMAIRNIMFKHVRNVTHARHTEPLSATNSALPALYTQVVDPPVAGRSSIKEIEPLSAT